jgi:hypothetical protein
MQSRGNRNFNYICLICLVGARLPILNPETRGDSHCAVQMTWEIAGHIHHSCLESMHLLNRFML